MKTPAISIIFFAIAAFFGALGQYLYKSGADQAGNTVSGYLLNPRLIGGVICYVLVMVLFVAAFKRGGEMSVLYPVYASTFIWAAVIAMLAFGTPIKPVHVGGMALLIAGMYLMGR
jgi:multidrug transporter EmrE-like cation transporter